MGKERAVRQTTWGSLLVVAVGALLFSACAWCLPQFRNSRQPRCPPHFCPVTRCSSIGLSTTFAPLGEGTSSCSTSPKPGDRNFVKRVIGVPGDVVQEQAGRLTVNGLVVHVSRTDPSDPAEALNAALGPERVPADRLYVLGDNWRTSLDSRFWGTVDEREVVGKAVLICWSRGTHWWDVHWNRIGRWLE